MLLQICTLPVFNKKGFEFVIVIEIQLWVCRGWVVVLRWITSFYTSTHSSLNPYHLTGNDYNFYSKPYFVKLQMLLIQSKIKYIYFMVWIQYYGNRQYDSISYIVLNVLFETTNPFIKRTLSVSPKSMIMIIVFCFFW